MEISGFSNLADLVKSMEDPLPSDPHKEMKSSSHEDFSGINCEQAAYDTDKRPLKQLRASSYSPADSNIPTTFHFLTPIFINPTHESKPPQPHSKLAAHHSLAERKRREKLSQRFVALSTLIPGLKKMDKGSILEDAVQYMKRLEERVKVLEERAKKRSMDQSMIFTIKKDDGDDAIKSSSQENCFPLIRVRFCEKEMLVSIDCERRNGVFEEIVGEVEKLSLSIVKSSLITFGDSYLSITLVIEKKEEGKMSMEVLVRNLQGVLRIILGDDNL